MNGKILVVEDEAGIAENITYALQTEGLEVCCCTTARQARDTVAHETICLIILDVGLPDGNGFDFCRELRQNSRVPVIFLTARASEIDRVVGLELGADDYVVKPFSPRELCARVRAVLRRTGDGVCDPSTDRPGFSIDRDRMELSYQGHRLGLSLTEFRLMEVLIGQPGRVFTRDQLMDQAWQEPGASLDRTVDTHIKTLRAKLRAVSPEADPIKTHRGIGYSLRDDA
jgi:two-component system catabolic regulation response regulator CreB